MKRYNELTKVELANCTDEDIQKLIELEAAHEGLIPCSPPKAVGIDDYGITPTEKFYVCRDLYFLSKEEAETFLAMKVIYTDYYYECGYDIRFAKGELYTSSVKEVLL